MSDISVEVVVYTGKHNDRFETQADEDRPLSESSKQAVERCLVDAVNKAIRAHQLDVKIEFTQPAEPTPLRRA